MSSTYSNREKIRTNSRSIYKTAADRGVSVLLSVAALISVITTAGIVVTLVIDSSKFFRAVDLKEIFTADLAPLAREPSFGFLPLIAGTLLTSVIAMLVAVPVGITAAIYMSEFAGERTRRIVKPVMELLAGIPTIVYGFFAYSTVTPLLMRIIPGLSAKNMLSPGIVMGIMIVPIVASLSEDALNSVPASLREGSLALGSTELETAVKVVFPAATSGIVASVVLGLSRAIGETMIVAIASGSSKNFTLDVTKPLQTMTAYIVEFTSGDAGSGTVGYYSLYAVGLLLFVFTLLMNLIAQYVSAKFREEY